MHSTLQPRTNVWLLALWLAAAVFVSLAAAPIPRALLGAGAILGAVAGFVQLQALRASSVALVAATSAMGVRRALASSRPGRLYLFLFWASALLLIVLSLYLLGSRFVPGWAASYSTFAFVRELLTLPGTLELRKIALPSQL